MAKTEKSKTAGMFESKFSALISRHKWLLVIIGIVLVVALIASWIGISAAEKKADQRQLALNVAEDTYHRWAALEDKSSSEAVAQQQEITTELQALAQRKGSSYPTVKAQYLLGLMAFEQKDYQQALQYFETIVHNGKSTYLSSLALFNAAVVHEELGDEDAALEQYQTIYDTWGTEGAESAKALFNVARIQEERGNLDLAKALFQQLADDFPASEYAKLAQTKVVVLP
ncbi:MAG: tetratricopeptide repeat protein [Sphaerochaetaceae bacterium]|jgi:tetratricopeptide (TPR) repeat protein